MKPAKEFADAFCRKHIINSRDGNPVLDLIEAVQQDALRDVKVVLSSNKYGSFDHVD